MQDEIYCHARAENQYTFLNMAEMSTHDSNEANKKASYPLDTNLMYDVRTTVQAHYTNHTSALHGRGEILRLQFCSIKPEQLINQSSEKLNQYRPRPRLWKGL